MVFTLNVNLLVKAVVLKSIKLEIHLILFNTAIAGVTALCLTLSAILLPSVHTLMIQFYNTLFQSNIQLLKLCGQRIAKHTSEISTLKLLKQGNQTKIYIKYTRLYQN